MNKEIHTIHWNKVEDLSELNKDLVKDFELYVFWPAPFNHDDCFMEAGFDDFRDESNKWDKEFEMILYDIFSILGTIGNYKIQQRAFKEKIKGGLFGFGKNTVKDTTTLFEQAEYSFRNDNSENLIVEFGERAVLIMGEGHTLFCILTKDRKLIEIILNRIGTGRKIKKTELIWSKILPREFFS